MKRSRPFSNAGRRRTCAFRNGGRNPLGKALYLDKQGIGPMRIERRFTKQGLAGQEGAAYAEIE
ncbi:MAG: hypothetical protein E5X55_39135, partial [Mesorhizobium sp.]